MDLTGKPGNAPQRSTVVPPESLPESPPSAGDPHPERENTDDSLSTERSTSNAAIHEMRVGAEQADRVMELARKRADTVLSEAREIADQDLGTHGVTDALAEDRAEADEVLQDEHDAADALLQRERNDYARTLCRLLPLERERTDRNLITERARSDSALANRNDFLGIVSHDLKNLLTGIVMSTELLSDRMANTEHGTTVSQGTQRILLYSARMKRLIADLVDVTSIDAGRLSVNKVWNNAGAAVTDALEGLRLLASAKEISLECEMPTAALMVKFDHERILQVLSNLVANSIKFTGRGGYVLASVERLPVGIHFSVSDNGAGIPDHMLESVFERFWQAGKGDRRGSGLGLYIAKNIITAHAGTIWAESQLGVGSVFHFTLPVEGPVDAPPAGVLPA